MARLKQEIRSTTDARDKERWQVVLWATSGQHSLKALATLAGRARSTIQISRIEHFKTDPQVRLRNSTQAPWPAPPFIG